MDERPGVVDRRERAGDWEGDTFYGRHRKGPIAALVERKTGLAVARRMPNTKAASLNAAVQDGLQGLPAGMRKTLTVDNGSEFAAFKRLEEALQLDVYFAHPYSARERGLNENTIGLLRQYFPRRTDLSNLTDEQLQEAVNSLNDRPRKRLSYRTPREVFEEMALALDP